MAGTVVLMAIDGSVQAEAAFDWYINHVHKEDNSIIILHCVDVAALQDGLCDAMTSGKIWEQQNVKSKELESKYRWKLNDIGIPGKIRRETGKPGDVIIKIANEERVNLIVMGSRGLGRLQRTFAGSVSDHVLHHARCPVIICKRKHDE